MKRKLQLRWTAWALIVCGALPFATRVAAQEVAQKEFLNALWGPGSTSFGRGCPNCRLQDFERDVLIDDVYHYRWTVQVGPGELDRLRFHRVVRERAPMRPIRTADAILLTHGARTGFAGTFLSTVGPEGLDPGHNLPVFLAQRNVDVWGVDLRWTLIPADATELDELASWGMERDATDLGIALSVARWGRFLTGSGLGKLDLLGYSWGGRVGYAYLNAETKLPSWLQRVERYVALEGLFKTADEAIRTAACGLIDVIQAQIDGGDVATSSEPLAAIGQLALTAPEDPSPFFPEFTNRQVALIFGTQGSQAGLLPLHAFAAFFEGDLPIGLRYTQERAGFNLLASASGFQPRAGGRDLMIVLCDDGRSTLDDNLAKVTTPVLYIGAAGGFDGNGLDTFPFLGGVELQSLIIGFEPPENVAVDVGHADVVMMDPADELVWQPIFEWVTAP